jgi:hypothetical protein
MTSWKWLGILLGFLVFLGLGRGKLARHAQLVGLVAIALAVTYEALKTPAF